MLRYVVSLALIAIILLPLTPSSVFAQAEPLYVIFVWHYHQPWYYDATSGYFVLPWVRMHSVGNYYKMAYIISKYPDVKATFTFSGSLLTQLIDYVERGLMDYRQVLSYRLARGESLGVEDRFSMLQIPGGFFDINWNRIVNVVPKYRELRDRAQEAFRKYVGLPEDEFKRRVVSEFSEQDILDLACLFNLFWVDPLVLRDKYPELYRVRESYLRGGYSCSREVLEAILRAHIEIMAETIPLYRELLSRGQVEVIPVPYSHPLAPILTAFGLEDDLYIHVNLSLKLFRDRLGYSPKGVWPAELAVNEDVLRVFARSGLHWTIADDTVLFKSVPDLKVSVVGGVNVAELYLWLIDFNGTPFYVFFRNSGLSNLVSFTYSTMGYSQAVSDLMSRLKSIASANPGGLIVIALDGENPWEHYEEFGDLFLEELYRQLSIAQREGVIKTVTPSEYIALKGRQAKPLPSREHLYLSLKSRDISDTPLSYTEDAYQQLPRELRVARIAEGSWAGGELAIWIGQRQENAAWMLLVKAREDILSSLGARSLSDLLEVNPATARYILMAEASDWFWWYGGDGGGFFPTNLLFKPYLAKAYEEAGLKPPDFLRALFNPDGTPIGVLEEAPRAVLVEPKVDGVLDEPLWGDALRMSVGAPGEVLLAVSPSSLAVGFKLSRGYEGARLALYLTNPWRSVSPYNPGYNSVFRDGSLASMGLAYEILVDLGRGVATVNVADGRGGWTQLFKVTSVAIRGSSGELLIPWHLLSLTPGDLAYVVAVVYVESLVAGRSDRVGLTHVIQVPRAAIAPQARVVFEMDDPEGDDDGAGGYKYPLNPVFKPGVFDLTKFRVSVAGDKVIFEVYVRNLGGNPWGGPNGFSMQYVHIYIRTTLKEPGRSDTFGLNVNLSEGSRWHVAILVAPGWGSDPVPRGERSAIYYYNGSVRVQDGDFKVYADPSSNAIVAEVSTGLLPDVDNIDSWVYTVFLTSYDGYGPDRIRPFGVESQEWVVGAGARYAQAIVFNVVPRVMDLLAPTREAQYSALNTFKVYREKGLGEPAVVSGVSKTAITQPTTPTTVTVTIKEEATLTQIQILTATEYLETTVRETPRSQLLAALAVGLALGLLVGAVLFRRRS